MRVSPAWCGFDAVSRCGGGVPLGSRSPGSRLLDAVPSAARACDAAAACRPHGGGRASVGSLRPRRVWRGAAWLLLAAALCLSASVPAQTRDAPARLPAALEDAELDEDGVTLTFAEPMQVWENRVETDRLQLTPSLPTSCSWASDTELSCSFGADHKPRRATRYRGALAAGLVTRSGRTLGALRFEVDSARPEVRAWIEGWDAGRPRVVVFAGADVDPASFAQALRLEIGGRAYPAVLSPVGERSADEDAERRYRLRLPELPRTAALEVLSLDVQPGLRSLDGPLTGTQSRQLVHALDREPFRLRAAECNGPKWVRRVEPGVGQSGADAAVLGPCVPAEPLRLSFSRMPTDAGKAALAGRLPPGLRLHAWEQEAYWNGAAPDEPRRMLGAVAVLEIVEAESAFVLALDGLSAPVASEASLKAASAAGEAAAPATIDAADAADAFDVFDALIPVRLSLRSGPPRPRLEATGRNVLLSDPQALSRHARAVNAPAVVLDTLQVAAGIERGTLALPDSRGRRAAVQAPAREAALAGGGWVRWTADVPAPERKQSLEWAAPQFDLLAVGSREEVLVWARRWDDGGPVAGAEVELLRAGGAGQAAADTVVARARTGADGVARLPLPARGQGGRGSEDDTDTEGRSGLWLIRAAGAGQARAVLPLRHEGGATALSRRASPDLKLWGVSDRPLYRAGDSLQYRLWWREPHAGRLRLPAQPLAPRTLALVAEQGRKTVLQWRLTPDADAGADGALRLPRYLTDGTYCIREDDNIYDGGVCVYVGSFRTQDLWVKAQAPGGVLRPGGAFDVALSGGYYSGGVAAGVPLEEVDVTLQPQSPAAVYPAFADYEFLVELEDEAASLPTPQGLPAALDADGRARLRIALPSLPDAADAADMVGFGTLRLSAAIRPAGSDSVAAEPVEAVFAAAERYVGLRLQPSWPDADDPLSLAAVVIDAEGRAIAGEAVRVEVEFVPDTDTDDGAADATAAAKAEPIARCTLRSGAAEQPGTACRVPRTRSGRYRFTAQADGAAPARLERYVWAGDGRARTQTELMLERAPQAAGEPLTLRLQQPHLRATALLAVEAGGVFLDVRTVRADAGQTRIALPLPARAQGVAQVRVHAWVAADGTPADAVRAEVLSGARRPAAVSTATAVVPLPTAPATDTVELAFDFDGDTATPGAQAWLVLRNRSAVAQRVTLSVQDDGLRALAAAFLDGADPKGVQWLGDPQDGWGNQPWSFGFAQWVSRTPGRLLWAWPDAEAAYGPEPARGQAVRNDGFVAVDSFTRQNGATPPVVFDADSEQVESLDMVMVTGSRIEATPPPAAPAGAVQPTRDGDAGRDRALATGAATDPRDTRPPLLSASAAAALSARVRERFLDTALWRPVVALAPGQVLRIPMTLPDNLTRWRALAWSSGADGGFALTEATREVGLPLEVRLQAPVRLYPGDRALLAANVRQIGSTATEVVAGIAVRAIASADAVDATAATTRWDSERALTLAAGGQAATTLEITLPTSSPQTSSPQAAATLRVEARAGGTVGGDAVGGVIEVAPATLSARKRQAGWLQPTPQTLALPTLPAGATAPQLQLSLLPGAEGLMRHWTADLRDYPHRCWEQILSRAVAAALAIERGAGSAQAETPQHVADASHDHPHDGPHAAAQYRDDAWPDAAAAVREALDNVAVFQRQDGSFRYFADSLDDGDSGEGESVAYLPLTAYSLQALRLLRSLGHPVSEEVLQAAGEHLDEQVSELSSQWLEAGDDEEDDEAAIDRLAKSAAQPDLTRVALALGSGVAPDAGALEVLWAVWPRLPLTGRLALARALAEASDARAGEAVDRLLKTAAKRGDARRLAQDADAGRWMQSDQSLQCELIALLRAHPALGDAALRRSLVIGLTDLYAGGAPAVDTYTGATCLAALRGLEEEVAEAQLRARLQTRQGVEEAELQLASQALPEPRPSDAVAAGGSADPSTHAFALDPADVRGARLRLDATLRGDAPVGYVAELAYVEDITRADASALGFSLERRYAVFRDGDWRALDLSAPAAAPPRAGEWVRVTLVLRNARERYFVAITDAVPGGLRPADLMLGGQAGLALQRVSDTGSDWFRTRRLDARAPKFYAEWLPAGTHEVHYFARAANAGDYLAAPAQAELMYGETSHARTAAARLRIAEEKAERDAEGDGGR